MAYPIDLVPQQLVALPRASLVALRGALLRDAGVGYAGYLQEAGYAGGETRFQLLARVTDIRRHVSVTLKADLPEDADGRMSVPSWIPVHAGANWHERETHEMFGINFEGHPDLRNMYLPGDFEGHPLRKDFPLLARMVKPWPGIVDVEPMPVSADGGDES